MIISDEGPGPVVPEVENAVASPAVSSPSFKRTSIRPKSASMLFEKNLLSLLSLEVPNINWKHLWLVAIRAQSRINIMPIESYEHGQLKIGFDKWITFILTKAIAADITLIAGTV